MGLEGLLYKRENSLFGILNGLDYEECNPATDKALAANFNLRKLDDRAKNKSAFQEKAGLPVNIEVPLLGLAARLVNQKGIEILVPDLELVLRNRCAVCAPGYRRPQIRGGFKKPGGPASG
jgi:starch synthase